MEGAFIFVERKIVEKKQIKSFLRLSLDLREAVRQGVLRGDYGHKNAC